MTEFRFKDEYGNWLRIQKKLVSGTNIKTINNESLLGSGNITIQSGGVTSVNGQTGTVVLNCSDVGALASTTTLSDLATTTQMDAIDSGITSSAVTAIGTALQPNDNISELVNNVGYITGITSSDVTTALGYTPYNSSNPNGYTANVGTVTSVNNISPVSGNVTLSIPTDTSDLTNGAGYITSSSLSGYQTTSNLVTSISSQSTDTQYPSAKCVYDIVGDIETLLSQV